MLLKFGIQHQLIKRMRSFDFYKNFRIYQSDISALKGEIKIFHNGTCDGNYALPNENVEIILSLPREISAKDTTVIFYDAYNCNAGFKCSGKMINSDKRFDYFNFNIESMRYATLYFFYFEINAESKIYGFKFKNSLVSVSFSVPEEKNCFQITITDEIGNYKKIPGIIYHIFVDRFRKSKESHVREGGILIEDWYSNITEYPEYPGAYLKNNTFFGGNLYGITEKLDYLASLGVSIIYLSPIFESPSNHKYDTSDYEKIDEGFGGEVAFEELIKKAGDYNIKIILDGVFNHTGADSKYFNRYNNYDTLGAFQSKKSPYYSWYRFTEYPEKYVCWWGIDILPRIFYESSDAENYFVSENGIIDKWIKKGVFGFRLDVADELLDSFIEKIRRKISKTNEHALLYGEVWEDASNKVAYGVRKKYYLGNELSGVMNYPLMRGIIDYIRNKKSDRLDYAINEIMLNMPKRIRHNTMNILGSHDTARIISALSEVNVSKKSNDELSTFKMNYTDYLIAKNRLISAYTLITALPGIPTVYYGDEAGLEGYSDPFNRKAYPWEREDCEILNHYKRCGNLRIKKDVFFDGDFHVLHLDDDLFIFERKDKNERFVIVYNNSKENYKIEFFASATEILSNKTSKEFLLFSEKSLIFKAEMCKIKIGCYVL